MVNALSAAGQADITVAEELAEAVTFFLYRVGMNRIVSTSEVFSVIEAALASTGFEAAAIVLSEHRYERKLKRCRVEVVNGRMNKLSDVEKLYKDNEKRARSRWDKSRIVEDLIVKHGLDRQIARVIASMAEEKVFSMDLSLVPADLVRQLVLNDTVAMVHAQQQLQTL